MTLLNRRQWLGAGATGVLSIRADAQHPPRAMAKLLESVRNIGDALVRIRTVSRVSVDASLPGANRFDYEYGSGFFIGANGYIMTAAHVVRPRKDVPRGNDDVSILAESPGRWTPVDVGAEDTERDLAILHANPSAVPASRALSFSDRPPGFGSQVFALGFRATAAINDFEMAIVAGTVLDRRSDIEMLFHGDKRSELPWLAISQNILGGYSGGPLLDSSGNVTAVLAGVAERRGKPMGFSLAIGAQATSPVLARLTNKKDAGKQR